MKSTPVAPRRCGTRSATRWVYYAQTLRGERTAVVISSDGDDNKSFVPFPRNSGSNDRIGRADYPLYVPSGLIPEGSVPPTFDHSRFQCARAI